LADLEAWFVRFAADLSAKGARVWGPYVCPHRFAEPCRCKKPNRFLYERAAREHGIDLAQSFVIGDAPDDMRAARLLGARGCLVRTGWAADPDVVKAATPDASVIAASIAEAVGWILESRESTPADTMVSEEAMDVARGDFGDFRIRPAIPADAQAITLAHLDSIRSLGPVFYPEGVVQAWSAGLDPALYVNAMNGGEAFFIATGRLDHETVVLGFSTHRVDDAQDGASVYVRGRAARRGIGTLLLQQAEEHARARGASSIQIQASLAGLEFYKANGFEILGRGHAELLSGHSMPCVLMRKLLR
jgi:GNAT superfamily N-acetyltransferase